MILWTDEEHSVLLWEDFHGYMKTPKAFNTRQLLIYGVTGLELAGIVNRGCINLASKVSPTGPLLLIFLLASTKGEVYRYQVDSSTARVWDTQCWKSWIVSSLDKDVRESSCLSLSVSINKWINYRELYSPPGPQREDVQLVHLTWEKWNCKITGRLQRELLLLNSN